MQSTKLCNYHIKLAIAVLLWEFNSTYTSVLVVLFSCISTSKVNACDLFFFLRTTLVYEGQADHIKLYAHPMMHHSSHINISSLENSTHSLILSSRFCEKQLMNLQSHFQFSNFLCFLLQIELLARETVFKFAIVYVMVHSIRKHLFFNMLKRNSSSHSEWMLYFFNFFFGASIMATDNFYQCQYTLILLINLMPPVQGIAVTTNRMHWQQSCEWVRGQKVRAMASHIRQSQPSK